MSVRRRAGWLLLAVEVAAVAWLTLTPRPPRPEALPFSCLVCGDIGGLDVLNNLIMLLPLGAAAFLLDLPFWAAVLGGLVLSGSVEFLQATLVPGRDASLSDLLTNTTSAGLGWLLARALPRLVAPGPVLARRLIVGWSAMAAALLALGAAFVQPATPRGEWYAQWAPRLGNFDVFTGQVLEARLADDPFWRDTHPDPATLAARLRSAPWSFEAVATGGEVTKRLAPIVSVYTGDQRKVVILGQRGTAVAFTPRTRSEDWRFRSLLLETPPGAIKPGAVVHASGSFGGGRISVRAAGPEGIQERAATLSPTLLWAFVTPVPVPLGGLRWFYTACWLLLLAGPLGYWLRMAPRLGFGGVGLVGASLWIATAAGGLPPPSGPEWLLLGGAVLAGMAVRALSAR